MDKFRVLKISLTFAICAVLAISTIVLAEPGSSDDPVVSKSYIENTVIPQIKSYVDSKVSESSTGVTENTQGSYAQYNVVEVSNGQTLIATKGTELILRMGSGTIIATQKGGLSDTTAGFDLANGTDMPSNHLLIVPVADGRGFKATSDVLVMVRGGYEIK